MTAPIVNGFAIIQIPNFHQQYVSLQQAVIDAQAKDPVGYKSSKPTKLLAAIDKIIFEIIPADPTNPAFNQGNTLGKEARHWKRVVFFQQYRLFFRYDLRAKIIVLGWFNDESTLRAYESKDDAYRVFRKMLERGNPPNTWKELLAEAQKAPRLNFIVKKTKKID